MGIGNQEKVGDDRCWGSLTPPPPFNLIDRHINCFNCSQLSVVLKNNFGLARPATPAPVGIGTASPLVPAAVTVPSSALCVDKPPQYLGPVPSNMAQAPATFPHSTVVAVSPLISPSSEAEAVLCPYSLCLESSSASLVPASALNAPAIAPARLDTYPLLAVARATASTIQRAPCIDSFLAGKQQSTLSPPPSTANHLAWPLLKKYAELGCSAVVGPAWTLITIIDAISNGPHASTLKPEATAFCR